MADEEQGQQRNDDKDDAEGKRDGNRGFLEFERSPIILWPLLTKLATDQFSGVVLLASELIATQSRSLGRKQVAVGVATDTDDDKTLACLKEAIRSGSTALVDGTLAANNLEVWAQPLKTLNLYDIREFCAAAGSDADGSLALALLEQLSTAAGSGDGRSLPASDDALLINQFRRLHSVFCTQQDSASEMEHRLIRQHAQRVGETVLSRDRYRTEDRLPMCSAHKLLKGTLASLNAPYCKSADGQKPAGDCSAGKRANYWLWPMFELILQLIWTVERCVFGYFVAFISCWNVILIAFVALIFGYYRLLGFLIERLTMWPMNLIGIIGIAIALGGVALILSVLR